MAYVKNDPHPAFSIPYTVDGEGRDLDSTPPGSRATARNSLRQWSGSRHRSYNARLGRPT
jgi:hypothetical protein